MREILFRGKRIDNGEWAYGDLRHWKVDSVGIHQNEWGRTFKVELETVGQYTGLIDKNGKRIFEGDILNIEFSETVVENAVIGYVGASFYGSTSSDDWELDGYCNFEIIGNIHDNPELLKGGEEESDD